MKRLFIAAVVAVLAGIAVAAQFGPPPGGGPDRRFEPRDNPRFDPYRPPSSGPAERDDARRPSPSYPWQRDLMIRQSGDGRTFGAESVFVEAAGVPSAIRDASGRLLVAFQWFPMDDTAHFDRVAVVVSGDDGRTWSAPVPISVAGLPAGYQRPFDPTLALTEDGFIRIYFSSNPAGMRGGMNGVATHSAISTDGVHFEFEPGARLAVDGEQVVDPAVWKLGETWHITAPISVRPNSGAYHGVSRDGLNFTRVGDIKSVENENWTGNLVGNGPGMSFYGGSMRGLWWSRTYDGVRWSRPEMLGIRGGDPTVVRTSGDTMLLIYVGEQVHPERIRLGNISP